jgi:hypothetical protein
MVTITRYLSNRRMAVKGQGYVNLTTIEGFIKAGQPFEVRTYPYGRDETIRTIKSLIQKRQREQLDRLRKEELLALVSNPKEQA